MFKRLFFSALALIAAFFIISYVWIGLGDEPFDDQARAFAPGQFAELTSGKLHYVWVEPEPGSENGETIVMLHGLYIPHFMFAQNAEALSEAGYRVLLPDMFGHGFSDRPTEKYDPDFFERQIDELLVATGIDRPFYLAGQSTGGMAATLYASKHPDNIKGLVLMVPAGLRMHGRDDDFVSNVLRTPVAGDWLWRTAGRRELLAPWDPPCDVCGSHPLLGDPLIQTKYRGYFPAMLNILRNFPLRNQDFVYQAAGKESFPVLALYGGRDETVHEDSAEIFSTAIPKAEIVILKNGDHGLNFRKHEEVNPIILSFLASVSAKDSTNMPTISAEE